MSTNLLNLSDEELMNLDPSALEDFDLGPEDEEEEVIDSEDQGSTESTEQSEDQDDSESEEDADESATEDGEGDSEEGEVDPDKEDSTEEVENEASEEAEESDKKEEKSDDKTEAEKAQDAIDYKREYERLLAPFKANGKEIQVTSVEDAITLMQMGANYNKKMAALKPNLKLMKMLENSNLLSEEKLSYLIDLDKKDPGAISKLVKDSGLDPLDLDADTATGYTPKSYAVDEREMDLDAVLEEIQDTPTYSKTLDVVSNKWDRASKQTIANTPQLLKVINDHIDRGIYDLISKEVESERLFGRLSGLSDLEAYRQVGDAIQARGGFAHLGRQQQQTPTAPVVVAPKPKKVEDPKIRDKRRAASSTKSSGPATTPADFNPLALSDEEFSKAMNSKFL